MEFSSLRDAPGYKTFGSVPYWFELKNGTRILEGDLSDNPAELGIVTGLLATAFLFNLKVTVIKEDFVKASFHLEHLKGKAMFHFVLNLACFCVFSPLVFSSLVFICAYRCAVFLVLKIQLGETFAGLLEGPDSVWAVEDASCKSVINVAANLETTPNASNADLLRKLRELAQQRFVSSDSRLRKLSCLRKRKYGYFYWERCNSIDITEHVRWLDSIDDEETQEKKSNEESFNKMLSKLCTRPLPREDQASWEILVSRSHEIQNDNRSKDIEEGFIYSAETNTQIKNVRVPIFFRLHHTLGDGFTLSRLLLSTLADSEAAQIRFEVKREETLPTAVLSRDKPEGDDFAPFNLSGFNTELMMRKNKDLLGASMPFSPIISVDLKETVKKYVARKLGKLVSFPEIGKSAIAKIKESVQRLTNIMFSKLCHFTKMTVVLIGMPSCFIRQALRSMDNSALHVSKLSGEKIVSSWMEGDSRNEIGERNLFTKIRQVKNATGTRFGDVILAAFSASLHEYFKQIGESAPQSLTVVLPSRMSVSDENSRFDNGFSVGLLPLCISGSTEVQMTNITQSNKDFTIIERLFDVARNSRDLRARSDYLVNFWVMKWLSAVLPEVLLRPILKSYCTLIYTNIAGPQEVHISGNRLRDMVFWAPNRGTTGISLSVLSYGENMHLGLLVDKALIKNSDSFSQILKNTVQEIDNLHETIFM